MILVILLLTMASLFIIITSIPWKGVSMPNLFEFGLKLLFNTIALLLVAIATISLINLQ